MNPTEFTRPLYRCFVLLRKCYIYFFNKGNAKLGRHWRLYCFLPFVIAHNVSMWLFLSKVFTEEVNVFEVAYMVPVCMVSLQAILKAATVLYKKSDIENLVDELIILWETSNFTDKQIETKKLFTKRLKLSHSVYYYSNILGTWLHLLAPLSSVLLQRYVLGQHCELVLPFGAVYPYDISDNWFIYLGTYTFQVYTMCCEIYAYVGSEFLMVTLSANIAIEFSILRENLVHVSPHLKTDNLCNQTEIELERCTEPCTSASIGDFIRRHQKLTRLAKQLDDIFNGMIFINILFVTINLCFFGFATTVARGILETANNLVAVVALLLPTYIFCYYGELLKNESSGIANLAYTNLWYKGDIRYQKMIHFIIARSQRPCCLTSLRYMPVTLTMFSKVLSTTWSFFSVVTSLYSDDELNIQ